jgi:hypothetical protein
VSEVDFFAKILMMINISARNSMNSRIKSMCIINRAERNRVKPRVGQFQPGIVPVYTGLNLTACGEICICVIFKTLFHSFAIPQNDFAKMPFSNERTLLQCLLDQNTLTLLLPHPNATSHPPLLLLLPVVSGGAG